jgi:hypothetical protein
MRGYRLPAALAVIVGFALTGCGGTPSCRADHEYVQAVNRPRLDLPANVTASERMAPLVIPTLPPDTEKLEPAPPCIDMPPSYAARRSPATRDTAHDPPAADSQ